MFAKKYYLILFLGLFPFVFSHPAMAVPGPDGPVDGVVYMERVPDDPGDLIHPLRVLGMSLGCTSWMSYSHDGLKANVVADPELEEEVCALIDILPVDYKDSFMIFDYGMYPPLVYLDRGAAHDSAFAWMEAKVKNQYDVRNFLLIGKQINPEDRTVEFRVKLKLPRTGPFANINSTLEGAFQAQILELLAATYSILGGAPEIQSAEEAGIEKLTQLLVAFLEGDFNGGITEEILILNGFQEFPIASSYNLNFFATNEPPAINGNIRDYARRKVYYQTGDTIEYVSVFAAAGISSFFDKFNLSSAFIFTDNSNYTQGASSEFENASIDFQYLDQTLIAWLHYFTFEDPAKPNKLYVKYDDNMTQEEAEAILDSLFNQYRYPSEPSDPPAVTSPKEKTGIFQRAEQRLNDCDSDPNSCDIFYWSNESGGWPKWRTKCCLMPHLDNLGNWVNVGVFNPLYLTLSQEAQDSMLMFIGGLGCGFVDGLIDVVATVGDVASFTGKALKHAPGTSMWFFDFLEKAWKKRALLKALKIKIQEDVNFWKECYGSVVLFGQFFANLEWEYIVQIFKKIIDEIKSWVGDALFKNGSRWAGYVYGKFIFDLVLDYLSAGVGKLSKVGKQVLKAMIEELKYPQALVNRLHDAYHSPTVKPWKKALARSGVGGCFTNGTTVWTASGLFSFEQLEPIFAPSN